jgi:hypothetical protein
MKGCKCSRCDGIRALRRERYASRSHEDRRKAYERTRRWAQSEAGLRCHGNYKQSESYQPCSSDYSKRPSVRVLRNDRKRLRRKTDPFVRQKDAARQAVRTAKRNGTLVRPDKCERCKQPAETEAHHKRYERRYWLDVMWLCSPCHYEIHSEAHGATYR